MRISWEFWFSGMRTLRVCSASALRTACHPPDGVGDELHALIGIELLDRLQQPFVADRDQLRQIESVSLVLFHVGDHEPQVGSDQPLGRLLVSALNAPREATFLSGIFYERQLLDVLQVLVECAGWRGFEKGLGLACRRRTGHALDSQR